MDLSTLTPAEGSVKKSRRLGRGQGSGRGGTSTRGHKGQKSRSGYSRRRGFEGGQMPLHRRLPKFGFTNINRKEYKAINISDLQKLSGRKNLSVIEVKDFIEAGMASKKDMIKILGNGELSVRIEVKAHAFSKTAKKAIEDAGGKAIKI